MRHRIAISDILDGVALGPCFTYSFCLKLHTNLFPFHTTGRVHVLPVAQGFARFVKSAGTNVFCVAMSTGGGVGGQGEVHGNPTIGVMVTVVCLVTCSAACLLLALSSTTVDAQTYHYRYVTDKTSALAILSYWINY